jgi:hypothetical protein
MRERESERERERERESVKNSELYNSSYISIERERERRCCNLLLLYELRTSTCGKMNNDEDEWICLLW